MLSQFDIFSLPFQLKFQKKETLKTAAGGILSICIIITGLAYFIYLMSNWIDGNMLPNYTSFQQSNEQAQLTEMIFTKSPVIIQMQMIKNGTNIPITKSILELTSNQVTFTDCFKQYGEQYNDSYCINVDTDKGTSFPLNYVLEMFVLQCNGSDYCQPLPDIIKLLDDYIVNVNIILFQEQFDTKNQIINEKKIIKSYTLDSVIFQNPIIVVSPQIIQIDTGKMFPSIMTSISSSHMRSDFAGMTRQSFDNKQQHLQNRELIIHAMSIAVDDIIYFEVIQYPKFGQILAEFNSIFSILLALGFLGRIMSSYEIFYDVQDTIINFYYNYSQQKILSQNIFQRLFSFLTRLFNFLTDYSFMQKKEKKTQKEISLLHIKEKTQYYTDAQSWIKELIMLRTAVQLLYEPCQWEILKYCKRNVEDYSKLACSIENNNHNHLEILEIIEYKQIVNNSIEEQKSKCINQFKDDIKQNQNNSELNIRLLSCLLEQPIADHKSILLCESQNENQVQIRGTNNTQIRGRNNTLQQTKDQSNKVQPVVQKSVVQNKKFISIECELVQINSNDNSDKL